MMNPCSARVQKVSSNKYHTPTSTQSHTHTHTHMWMWDNKTNTRTTSVSLCLITVYNTHTALDYCPTWRPQTHNTMTLCQKCPQVMLTKWHDQKKTKTHWWRMSLNSGERVGNQRYWHADVEILDKEQHHDSEHPAWEISPHGHVSRTTRNCKPQPCSLKTGGGREGSRLYKVIHSPVTDNRPIHCT